MNPSRIVRGFGLSFFVSAQASSSTSLTGTTLSVHPSANNLLAHSRQLLQRRRSILHIHGPVLHLLEVREDAGDGLADCGEGRGAEEALTTVKEADALFLEVHDDANCDASVEERACAYEGVGHAAGGCSILKGGLDRGFVLVDGESTRLLVLPVGTELRGNEAPDMGFGRRFDQEELGGDGGGGDGGGGDGGDDGLLTMEGVGEGVEGVVVDWDGGDGRGEVVGAALASEDCNFEASDEELVEDSWAEIASGLHKSLVSVFWKVSQSR